MKKALLFIIFSLLSFASQAEEILIAAAADLKFAMDEIVKEFKKQNPTDKINVIYGSSGTFLIQIQNGAPFDLYFSADIDYPRKLQSMNLTSSDVKLYAFGRIVIWSSQMDASKMTLKDLNDKSINRISIANPRHAPYGKRAVEAMKAVSVYEGISRHLLFAENVGQASQWVLSGNAQVGIIALSLAMSDEMKNKGKYTLIDEKLHQRLEQGYVITKYGENNKLAKQFAEYVSTKSARSIMERYGFVLPK